MLIPRTVLFGNPSRVIPQVSPDGTYLAYVAPDQRDVLQVWLRTLGGEDDRVLTADRKRGIRRYFWTFEPDVLVYLQDADGDENWHMYSVNVRTNVVRDLTPFQGIQAQPVAGSHRAPDQVLVAMNLNDRAKHDVYRVSLRNGAVEPDAENPGNIAGWTSDEDLQVRAALAMDQLGGQQLLTRATVNAEWTAARTLAPDEEGRPVSFSGDGSSLYFLSNQGAPATRLLLLDLATREETVVAEDPQYDVTDLLVHPTTFKVQAVGFYRERLDWHVIDPEIEADFEALRAVRSGDIRIVSRDSADETWTVAYLTDDGPIYFYAYDRPSRTSTPLFSNRPELEGLALARMQPVEFTARDSLTVHCYLSLPPDAPAGTKLPAVLWVHGGPWARDLWGFNPYVQWFANRSYAVLQVNYRGSTGYGRDFLNAGNREWGARMQDDLTDAVRWLIDQGIADPERVAIAGVSYGGYATLAGLTMTPDLYTAGVDIVGPSNLVTLLRSIPPYWAPMLGIFKHRVGNPDTEPDFLESRSPLNYADRIRAPLLIGQGANDPRVKEAESEQIVEAMRKAGLPVEYVVYSDEGHGFARPENSLHFAALAEQFLAKHLGGQCEPMGELTGHSGEIK